MAEVTGARYNAGFQGYMRFLQQSSQLVAPTATADPASQVCASIAGPCALPGYSINDNFQDVVGAGSGVVMSQVPGRRECSIQTTMDVCDGSFIANAFRRFYTEGAEFNGHTTPGTRATGWMNGLKLVTAEVGISGAYTDTDWAIQGYDALFQSVRFQIAENRPMTAQVELWPIAIVPFVAGNVTGAPTYMTPIIWQTVEVLIGDAQTDDYKPYVAGVNVGLNNNLERRGSKNIILNGAVEYWISRTAREIGPKLEQLQVSLQLHDALPTALQNALTGMGAISVYGEVPGVGAGRPWVNLRIYANAMNRRGSQEAQANNVLMFQSELASRAIRYEYGLTV
jgi:hypothetical protein